MKTDNAIYTITSPLHDEQAVAATTREFLQSLNFEFDFKGNDFSDYGSHALHLIYVRTGGTEGVFNQLLPQLQAQCDAPIYLLTSGKSNSLAASMEILSFLRQRGIKGEIIHGDAAYINSRVTTLSHVAAALKRLKGTRMAMIGKPSDWLISSQVCPERVKEALGIELVEIPMQELIDEIAITPCGEVAGNESDNPAVMRSLGGAWQIYHALESLVKRHNLNGFTLRCFDLLTAVKNTGCMALAQFNAHGIVASCEGDVPAMLSMAIAQALTGTTGFQANPARIDPVTGHMLFAHCTIPFNMVERYTLDTHFESGIGVGICGYAPNGPVTLFKVSGDLQRHFAHDAKLLTSQAKPDLCRTQQVIKLSDPTVAGSYFLSNPIGNHHVIIPGHHATALNLLTSNL